MPSSLIPITLQLFRQSQLVIIGKNCCKPITGWIPSFGYYYYADIKCTTAGTRSLIFANFSQPLSTISVYVCSSGQAAGVTLPPISNFCAGSTVQLTTSPTNGGNRTYVWKVNGVTKQSGTSATYGTIQLALTDVVSATMRIGLLAIVGLIEKGQLGSFN